MLAHGAPRFRPFPAALQAWVQPVAGEGLAPVFGEHIAVQSLLLLPLQPTT